MFKEEDGGEAAFIWGGDCRIIDKGKRSSYNWSLYRRTSYGLKHEGVQEMEEEGWSHNHGSSYNSVISCARLFPDFVCVASDITASVFTLGGSTIKGAVMLPLGHLWYSLRDRKGPLTNAPRA